MTIQAAKIIQRAFRIFLHREHSVEAPGTATLMQRSFRRYREKKFRALETTTIAVQALARGFLFRMAWKKRVLRNAFMGFERGYLRM